MPSGKQILLQMLTQLSQGVKRSPIDDALSDKVRAAFLLHGSTASEAWPAVEHIRWSTEKDEWNNAVREGLTCDGIFLSDLFEALITPAEIPPHVASKYPELSRSGYREALRHIWLVLTSVQWFEELAAVEDEPNSQSRGDALVANYIRKLRHFREHPGDFS